MTSDFQRQTKSLDCFFVQIDLVNLCEVIIMSFCFLIADKRNQESLEE